MTQSDAGIVDAGPLIAFFDSAEEFHDWSVEALAKLRIPLLSCEAVLTEAMYLLHDRPDSQDMLLDWIARGTLAVCCYWQQIVGARRRS